MDRVLDCDYTKIIISALSPLQLSSLRSLFQFDREGTEGFSLDLAGFGLAEAQLAFLVYGMIMISRGL